MRASSLVGRGDDGGRAANEAVSSTRCECVVRRRSIPRTGAGGAVSVAGAVAAGAADAAVVAGTVANETTPMEESAPPAVEGSDAVDAARDDADLAERPVDRLGTGCEEFVSFALTPDLLLPDSGTTTMRARFPLPETGCLTRGFECLAMPKNLGQPLHRRIALKVGSKRAPERGLATFQGIDPPLPTPIRRIDVLVLPPSI